MKYVFSILLLMFLTNCSFNKNSSFWTNDGKEKVKLENKFNKILVKSDNPMNMTFDEFEFFINDYNKKSKYPNINK